ncbi:hypothetical protein MMC18_004634 [Xylographa bjoerkii]|nr:hypothetical protein [Xylographa bjoerkii]
MAAPGLGIGDIVNACNYIYRKCRDYKDAVKEFDEIASKSKSTVVVVQKIDDEARESGSLVERAGLEAFKQLRGMLDDLAKDAKTLQALVEKYVDIQEIPFRRILFTFKESDNLADLRRRIGLHEQTLQLWYMTLMHGSLRRLENGQLDIIKAINGIPRDMRADLIKELRRGNERPLKTELRRRGVSKNEIKNNIEVAKTYVTASPPDQVRIESEVRSRSTLGPDGLARGDNHGSYAFTEGPYARPSHKGSNPDPHSAPTSSNIHRSHSAHAPKDQYDSPPPRFNPYIVNPHNSADYGSAEEFFTSSVWPQGLSAEHLFVPQSSKSRRRSSDTSTRPDSTPFLIVPKDGRHRPRPASYHEPRHPHRRAFDYDDDLTMFVEHEFRTPKEPKSRSHSRHSSTHSHHRRRLSADDTLAERAERIRMIERMARIDSMGV